MILHVVSPCFRNLSTSFSTLPPYIQKISQIILICEPLFLLRKQAFFSADPNSDHKQALNPQSAVLYTGSGNPVNRIRLLTIFLTAIKLVVKIIGKMTDIHSKLIEKGKFIELTNKIIVSIMNEKT